MDNFSGFSPPKTNFSAMPHELIDVLPAIQTIGEMKCILYILRHTWGFQDIEKRISLDEFENGRKKSNGERLDNGVGLSKPTIINGLDRGIEHGLIIVREEGDNGRIEKFYSLAIDSTSKDSLPPPVKNLYPDHRKKLEERKKDSPDPKNGSGETASEKPKTTVVHFKDVQAHWDVETQTWDDDRYIWIGRENPRYRLLQSDWQNPYPVSSYVNDRVTEPEARAKVIGMYEERLNAPKAISLYNRIPELKGKTLVCWCHPEACHGDVLARLANNPKFKLKSAWYEVVFKVFAYTGGRNADLQKMLQGTATKGKYQEYNLEPPMRDPQDLLDWESWFFAQQNAPPQIVESLEKVQSSIGAWRAWRLNRLEAPQPAPLPSQPQPLTDPIAAMKFPGMSISFEESTPIIPDLTPEEQAAAEKARIEGMKAFREKLAQQERDHPHAPAPGQPGKDLT